MVRMEVPSSAVSWDGPLILVSPRLLPGRMILLQLYDEITELKEQPGFLKGDNVSGR